MAAGGDGEEDAFITRWPGAVTRPCFLFVSSSASVKSAGELLSLSD